MLPVRRMRGDWWELNERGTMLDRHPERRRASARGPVSTSGSGGSTRRAVGWICCPPLRATIDGLMAKGKKRKVAPGDVATNRQASFRYNLLERFECGIVLTGTEVKSLREGKAQLKDSYADDARRRGVADRHVHPALRRRRRGRTTIPSAPASCCCTGARSRG